MTISQITNKDATLDTLSILEKLLISQIVYEKGTQDWSVIADKLSKHRLLLSTNSSVSSKHVKRAYELLMEDLGIDTPITDENTDDGQKTLYSNGIDQPKSKVHLSLAKKHYLERLSELKGLLSLEEEKFKKLVKEIKEIKSGKWDGVEPSSPSKRQKRKAEEVQEMEEGDAAADGNDDDNAVPETSPLSTLGDQTDEADEKEEDEADDETNKMDVDVDKKEESVVSTRRTRHQQVPSPTPPPPPLESTEAMTKSDTIPEKKRKRGNTASNATAILSPPPTTETGATSSKPVSAQTSTSTDTSKGARRKDKDDDITTPTPTNESTEKDRANFKRYQRALLQIHHQILELSSASPFRDPVRPSDAPDYTKLIKKPMDLKTIGKKIRDGSIKTSEELKRDVLLIFANAVMFNKRDSEIGKRALETFVGSERLINVFDSAEFQF